MSKYEKAERGGHDTPSDQARYQVMADVILGFLNSAQMQIFEIGCANGQLLALLKKNGYENVLGIDPSPTCAQIAMQRFGIQVNTGTLSNLNLSEGFADVIILAGVMEHVRDIDQALDKISFHTKNGGRVFISVPNASRYAEGEDAPFQEFSMEHINFFGPGSLSNLMATRGFVPIAMIEDILTVNHQTKTPVVHGIFGKPEEESSPPSQIIKDTKTISGLKNYITQCRSEDERIRKIVDGLVQEKTPLLVWGVGTHTLRLLAESTLGQANIVAFVDGNPRYHGCQVLNRPVMAPKVLPYYPDAAVLISSRAYQEEIALEIRQKLKCTNEIIRFYSLTK
jgi:SAM-dependent methyltransferase